MRILLTSLLVSTLAIKGGISQDDSGRDCFTILVGKDASAGGSVFVAHNEDNLNEHNFVDVHKVPRVEHAAGEKQIFLEGADSLDEVPETYGYLWVTGSKYNEEQYLNEWGVALTSNSSQSKVENGNGRIGHNLRRLVIERARTAREAVHIAGDLVERFGYSSSGRIYFMADPSEAWVFEVANGKHWIARRVPDDEVAIVPNYYVIDDFQQADTANFLSSPAIVDFATGEGWYDPQRETAFNFRKVYGHKNRLDAVWNIGRKWAILNQVSETQYDYSGNFPFSVRPKRRVNVEMLCGLLGNHYEGTQFSPASSSGSPHRRSGLGIMDTMPVCNLYNDYGSITQLRSWLPAGIGNAIWIAPRYPCIQPFIPWYYGIARIPAGYESTTYAEALANYNNKNRAYIDLYPDLACWVFDSFANRVDSCYGLAIGPVREWKSRFQAEILKKVSATEGELAAILGSDPDRAVQIASELTRSLAERDLMETRARLEGFK